MKKLALSSTTIFIIFSAFTFVQTPEKDILGTWKIDKESVVPMAKAALEATRKTNPEQAQKMEADMEKVYEITALTTYEFKDDNTYTVKSNTAPQPGTWAFSDDKKSLLLTRNSKTRKDSIVELSATRLQLIHGDRKVTSLFIRP